MKSGEAKLFAAILVVAVVLVAVALVPMLAMREPQRQPPPPPPELTGEDLAPAEARFRGNPEAQYTLVEFGDYQCAACKTAHERAKGWLEEHGERLRYVFHFFGVAVGLHSRNMARAAEAAAEQGKYWEMHDLLFANAEKMTRLSPQEGDALLMELAARLRLDMIKFRAAMKGEATERAVAASEDIAMRAGVQSTPHFFMVLPDGKVERLQFIDGVEQFLKDPNRFK